MFVNDLVIIGLWLTRSERKTEIGFVQSKASNHHQLKKYKKIPTENQLQEDTKTTTTVNKSANTSTSSLVMFFGMTGFSTSTLNLIHSMCGSRSEIVRHSSWAVELTSTVVFTR